MVDIRGVPQTRPTGARDVPQESGGAIKSLRELRDRIDVDRNRAEIIKGRLVVSPVPVVWHEMACVWLDDQLRDFCRVKGWFVDRHSEIDLPPTSDLIEPDLLVLRDAVKPRACALAGMPFYLLVDRFTDSLSVSLHSTPGNQGYATITTVGVGEKLHIPDPFDITIDTSALPLPR